MEEEVKPLREAERETAGESSGKYLQGELQIASQAHKGAAVMTHLLTKL